MFHRQYLLFIRHMRQAWRDISALESKPSSANSYLKFSPLAVVHIDAFSNRSAVNENAGVQTGVLKSLCFRHPNQSITEAPSFHRAFYSMHLR